MKTIIIFLLGTLLIAGGGFISFREFSNRSRKIEMKNDISYGRLKRGLIISAGNILLVSGVFLIISYNEAPETYSTQWSFMNLLVTFGCCIAPFIVFATLATFARLSITEGRLR